MKLSALANMARYAVFFSFPVLLPVLCFGQGVNGQANVSPDLASIAIANAGNPNALINVIVQFSHPPTPTISAASLPLQMAAVMATQPDHPTTQI